MANGKKAVILYCDLIHTVEKLDNETAGLLFKHYLRYVNDLNPETDNQIVDIVFEPIKQNLKRDLKKYEKKQVQWSEAGKRSAEVRNANKKERTLTDVDSRLTVLTVNVKDNVNVNVKDKVIVKDINSRLADFKKSLQPHLEIYGRELLNEFYLYWTETKVNGKKMKWEMEKTFDVERRLQRWLKNDFGKKEKSCSKKEKKDASDILLEKYGIK